MYEAVEQEVGQLSSVESSRAGAEARRDITNRGRNSRSRGRPSALPGGGVLPSPAWQGEFRRGGTRHRPRRGTRPRTRSHLDARKTAPYMRDVFSSQPGGHRLGAPKPLGKHRLRIAGGDDESVAAMLAAAAVVSADERAFRPRLGWVSYRSRPIRGPGWLGHGGDDQEDRSACAGGHPLVRRHRHVESGCAPACGGQSNGSVESRRVGPG